MSGVRHAGRTIQLELSERDGVWVPQEPPPPPRGGARPRRWLRRVLLGALTAGTGVLVAGVAFIETARTGRAQTAYWRSMAPGDQAALRDLVVSGTESGLPLYICRGQFAGGTHVGRYRADFKGCHVGHGGKEVEVSPFEVLGATWVDNAENGGRDPLVAGEIVDGGAGQRFASGPVFVCRAFYQGSVHPGALRAGESGCTFGYGGRAITSQNYSVLQAAPWMVWSAGALNALPESAVAGGEEGGDTFLICRAPTRRGLLPGKIKKGSPGCSVAHEGKELVERRFEVLTPRWRVGNGGAIPVSALAGGRGEAGLQYPCRGQSRGTVQLGRVSDGSAGCHIGVQGGEVVLQDYEVLSQ